MILYHTHIYIYIYIMLYSIIWYYAVLYCGVF